MMRHVKYLWHYVMCQWKHRSYHTDKQWELLVNGYPERTMGNGDIVPASPHVWLCWTACDKCGIGWTTSIEQIASDLPEGYHRRPLPLVADATFASSSGRNPRESN